MISLDLSGKTIAVLGVANERSIAWAVAQALAEAGARLVFSYYGERMKAGVEKTIAKLPESALCELDVADDRSIEAFFAFVARQSGGKLHGLVHSVAFADRAEFEAPFEATSREGYRKALDVSAYSLIATARHAAPLMVEAGSGSIVTMSFLGGERVVPGYKLMGPAKAALEANAKYLAESLGPKNIRVNAISAGALKTLSLAGIPGGRGLLSRLGANTALGRGITHREVALAALFLLSDWASGITGEVLHVDAGYHALAMPHHDEASPPET